MNPSKLSFVKMSGAGNDFVILDARAPDFDKHCSMVFGPLSRSALAKRLCRRNHSVGADGLVFIEPASGADFGWDFYNSDGSTAEMCGNAARCVARYAYVKGFTGKEMKFKTSAGLIQAKILEGDRVQVTMPLPKLVEKELPYLIDSGVPHVVIKENTLNDKARLRTQVPAHRMNKRAGPRGANVTFFSMDGEKKINAISFERGVEDFTLACGTGAMAVAFAARLEKPALRVFEVKMPGGRLEVEFPDEKGVVFLRGLAQIVAEGEVNKESVNEEL